MNRTERLLDLITYLLNASEPVSWQEIKNHFAEDYAQGIEESNQRKFERDKAELISLGIPIDYRSGFGIKKEGYTIEKEKLFLPEIEFKPEESSLLMLSAAAVRENESFPYRDQLESALYKLTSIHQPFSAPQEIRITYSGPGKHIPRSSWIRTIQDALERRKWIEIVYYAFTTGKTERRKVNPYGLIFRRGSWILVGWDHLRRDLRSFVLTRIQVEPKINKRRPGTPDYEIPENFSLKRYQNQQPWEYGFHEPMEVLIEVSTHRLPELSPQLSTAEPVGDRCFRLSVTNRDGLLSWILSQKTDLRVLEPEGLQESIQGALEKLL